METLYHYCPTAAFNSIISNRSIWLSELTSSNDTMESKWAAVAIAKLAERDGLSQEKVALLNESMELVKEFADVQGFCLSREADLLSQWRGYAGDATGVAIGFSKEYFNFLIEKRERTNLHFLELVEIEYEPDRHIEIVQSTYDPAKKFMETDLHGTTMRELLEERADAKLSKQRRDLFGALFGLFTKLYVLKGHGFREEKEWRLVSPFLEDLGEKRLYRAGPDRVIPYKEITLSEAPCSSIRQVILGPKHLTPVKQVKDFLTNFGFEDVDVKQSETTYR